MAGVKAEGNSCEHATSCRNLRAGNVQKCKFLRARAIAFGAEKRLPLPGLADCSQEPHCRYRCHCLQTQTDIAVQTLQGVQTSVEGAAAVRKGERITAVRVQDNAMHASHKPKVKSQYLTQEKTAEVCVCVGGGGGGSHLRMFGCFLFAGQLNPNLIGWGGAQAFRAVSGWHRVWAPFPL